MPGLQAKGIVRSLRFFDCANQRGLIETEGVLGTERDWKSGIFQSRFFISCSLS